MSERDLKLARDDYRRKTLSDATDLVALIDFQEILSEETGIEVQAESHEFVRMFLNLRNSVHGYTETLSALGEIQKAKQQAQFNVPRPLGRVKPRRKAKTAPRKKNAAKGH